MDRDAVAFKRRSVVTKHGRVCIIAAVGYNTPEYLKLLGIMLLALGVKFSDMSNGLAAVCKVPGLGWEQIIFIVGAIDGNCECSWLAGLHLSHAT